MHKYMHSLILATSTCMHLVGCKNFSQERNKIFYTNFYFITILFTVCAFYNFVTVLDVSFVETCFLLFSMCSYTHGFSEIQKFSEICNLFNCYFNLSLAKHWVHNLLEIKAFSRFLN